MTKRATKKNEPRGTKKKSWKTNENKKMKMREK